MTMWNPLKRLRSKRAGVTILAATVFPVMIGMVGLVTAYGDGLLTKLKAQRIADAAAYSGAVAYNQLGTSAAITDAADRDATVNGISISDMSASLVNSPTGDGNSAVEATVTMNVNVGLTQLVSSTSSLSVTANSYVELKGTANGIPCVIALGSSGSGVTLSGSGTITANTCAVSSDSATAPAITAPNGTTITTPVVSTPAALTSTQKANISPPTGTSSVTYLVKSVSDPLASKSAVTNAVSHLASVGLLTNPTFTAPTGGTSVAFAYSSGLTFPSGCSGVYNGSGSWTVTCTGAGPFNFGSITMQGGTAVVFNDTTPATYNFSGSISDTGNSLTFNGAGTYNIAGGLYTGGGSVTAFNGAGTFNIGQYASSCNGDYYSICHTGNTLTFAGPSNFLLTNGLYDSGGETMTLGSGTTNSYQIGASTNGYSINMGGGSFVTLHDASGAFSQFQATGNITNGGGSCLALPAATAHDINGYISLGGGGTLGSGVYTIYDYLALGAGGGGAVTCGGTSVGLKGSGVTLVIGANSTVSCSSSSVGFCITGGYSNVTLTAPTSGSTANIAVIGPTSSSNTAGAILTAGATGASITGAFYFPYGPFSMGGGASVGSGGCLEVIANQVTLSGGTAIASTCTGLGGTSLVNNLALVQ
jgi:Flp pilus assembly protein TadG